MSNGDPTSPPRILRRLALLLGRYHGLDTELICQGTGAPWLLVTNPLARAGTFVMVNGAAVYGFCVVRLGSADDLGTIAAQLARVLRAEEKADSQQRPPGSRDQEHRS